MSSSETSVARPSAVSPQAIAWPPGNAEHIARFIYNAAPRPNREVAIASTLGLLAGICGRQWQVSNTGLNLYVILVAPSATGKEAMHSGISALIRAVAAQEPRAADFVNFSDFASGPALTKALATNPCFVGVAGEFGHKFAHMARGKSESPLASLRKVMTDVYPKSSSRSMAGGIEYSNKDNNIASMLAVSYSMIGDTTPGTFYESVTNSMMADGFMSRLLIIQYHGDRPDKNLTPVYEPSPELVAGLAHLARHAINLFSRNHYQALSMCDEQLLEAFEQECDQQIKKAGSDESRRQIYNRAHLKALRVAALLAVADNCFAPSITTVHAAWAIALVRADIATFNARLESGDVGDDDAARKSKVIAVAIEYLKSPPPKYVALRDAYLIPDQYFQTRTQNLTAFKSHPLGANKALKLAIESLIDGGQLHRAMPADVIAQFPKARGVWYYLMSVPGAQEIWRGAQAEGMANIFETLKAARAKADAEYAARSAK